MEKPPLRRQRSLRTTLRIAHRAFTAARRLLQFVGHMLRSRVAVVMIFSSSEMSILEKGAMAVLGRVWRKRVVFCPRSGYIVREWRQQWWFRRWLPRACQRHGPRLRRLRH